MTGKAARIGISTLVTKYIDEDAVTAFGMKAINRLCENALIVHDKTSVSCRNRFPQFCLLYRAINRESSENDSQ